MNTEITVENLEFYFNNFSNLPINIHKLHDKINCFELKLNNKNTTIYILFGDRDKNGSSRPKNKEAKFDIAIFCDKDNENDLAIIKAIEDELVNYNVIFNNEDGSKNIIRRMYCPSTDARIVTFWYELYLNIILNIINSNE